MWGFSISIAVVNSFCRSCPCNVNQLSSPILRLRSPSISSIFSSEFKSNLKKMSCNGCRALRKRCSEDCIPRTSLQYIHTSDAQANTTLFVAKFFGPADLMSFISAVPHHQHPVLFQSLLFEACGRTVNPVSGVVGLICSGNWKICQDAVEAVLSGGVLRSIPFNFLIQVLPSQFSGENQCKFSPDLQPSDLSLSPFESDVSEGSFKNGNVDVDGQRKLLNLFV